MGWTNKQRNILDFAFNSLLRRKGKNSALFVVYAGIIFLVSSIVFSSESIKRESRILLENSPEIVVQRTVAGRHDLIPEQYIERLKSIRGVQEAKGRLWGYYLPNQFHPEGDWQFLQLFQALSMKWYPDPTS